jgi:hypothetical protein
MNIFILVTNVRHARIDPTLYTAISYVRPLVPFQICSLYPVNFKVIHPVVCRDLIDK